MVKLDIGIGFTVTGVVAIGEVQPPVLTVKLTFLTPGVFQLN
jgi:hypothetical protein